MAGPRGPYWKAKTSAAAREINRHGLADFRGYTSGVGTSFAEHAHVDIRPTLGTSLRGSALQFVLARMVHETVAAPGSRAA